MSRIVVVGAGGHARVVADVARCLGHAVVALVDELHGSAPDLPDGTPVLGSLDTALDRWPDAELALGVGDNTARLRRHRALQTAGRTLPPLIHPSAIVARGVKPGAGTVVAAGVVVNVDTDIGEAVVLNTGCSVDHDCAVGDGAHLAPGSRLAGSVRVGEGALIGIAACATPGVTIGRGAVCGAGAVVVSDVPDGRTVKGVPAR